MPAELKGDDTSLGSILLQWQVITEDDLKKALQQQAELRGDDLLGKLLIANGSCTEDEIEMAMNAQASMRGASKSKRAIAVADLALDRRRRKSIFERRIRLEKQARKIERSITGEDHPAIAAALLAKTDLT